jgi:hypothetical protein
MILSGGGSTLDIILLHLHIDHIIPFSKGGKNHVRELSASVCRMQSAEGCKTIAHKKSHEFTTGLMALIF